MAGARAFLVERRGRGGCGECFASAGTEGIALDFPDVSGVDGMLTVDWDNDFALDLALVGSDGFQLFRRTEMVGLRM